ncbi:MAG: SGNH/GDSL hydrolase family protein, partial [Oscillospiraceae bacterium]|nr:SGNH/GDSL hydrolase family protein [Oscillospiraceae bacterium]
MFTKKRLFWIFIALLLFFTILFALQRLLMPKYMSGVFEGRLIVEYYLANKSNDVIFLGDCEVYENISPIALWENFGITSYVRGSHQQLIWHSYYLLE